jgi:hypothetical protein
LQDRRLINYLYSLSYSIFAASNSLKTFKRF